MSEIVILNVQSAICGALEPSRHAWIYLASQLRVNILYSKFAFFLEGPLKPPGAAVFGHV